MSDVDEYERLLDAAIKLLNHMEATHVDSMNTANADRRDLQARLLREQELCRKLEQEIDRLEKKLRVND